jgi:predicted small lipoprotein YifL
MRVALSLIALALLSACGQKGALYLPDQEPTAVKRNADAAADAKPANDTAVGTDSTNEDTKRKN